MKNIFLLLFLFPLGALADNSAVGCDAQFDDLKAAESFRDENWLSLKTAPRNTSLIDLEELANAENRGLEVAFLVKDGRYRDGSKIVRGYIYSIDKKVGPWKSYREHYDSLTAREQKILDRKMIASSSAMTRSMVHSIQLTTKEPLYSFGLNSSAMASRTPVGWARKPHPRTMLRVDRSKIIEAKVRIP